MHHLEEDAGNARRTTDDQRMGEATICSRLEQSLWRSNDEKASGCLRTLEIQLFVSLSQSGVQHTERTKRQDTG